MYTVYGFLISGGEDASEIAKKLTGFVAGASDKYDTLPPTRKDGTSLQPGDVAKLGPKDDGAYQAGWYAWDGNKYVLIGKDTNADEILAQLKAKPADFNTPYGDERFVTPKQGYTYWAKVNGDKANIFRAKAGVGDDDTVVVKQLFKSGDISATDVSSRAGSVTYEPTGLEANNGKNLVWKAIAPVIDYFAAELKKVEKVVLKYNPDTSVDKMVTVAGTTEKTLLAKNNKISYDKRDTLNKNTLDAVKAGETDDKEPLILTRKGLFEAVTTGASATPTYDYFEAKPTQISGDKYSLIDSDKLSALGSQLVAKGAKAIGKTIKVRMPEPIEDRKYVIQLPFGDGGALKEIPVYFSRDKSIDKVKSYCMFDEGSVLDVHIVSDEFGSTNANNQANVYAVVDVPDRSFNFEEWDDIIDVTTTSGTSAAFEYIYNQDVGTALAVFDINTGECLYRTNKIGANGKLDYRYNIDKFQAMQDSTIATSGINYRVCFNGLKGVGYNVMPAQDGTQFSPETVKVIKSGGSLRLIILKDATALKSVNEEQMVGWTFTGWNFTNSRAIQVAVDNCPKLETYIGTAVDNTYKGLIKNSGGDTTHGIDANIAILPNCTTAEAMFSGSKLQKITVTSASDRLICRKMFKQTTYLGEEGTLRIDFFNRKGVIAEAQSMFEGANFTAMPTMPYVELSNNYSLLKFAKDSSFKYVKHDLSSKRTIDAKYAFSGCLNLEKIDFKIDIPNCALMQGMFENCSKLKATPEVVSNASSVENFTRGCAELKHVNRITAEIDAIYKFAFADCPKLLTVGEIVNGIKGYVNMVNGSPNVLVINSKFTTVEADTSAEATEFKNNTKIVYPTQAERTILVDGPLTAGGTVTVEQHPEIGHYTFNEVGTEIYFDLTGGGASTGGGNGGADGGATSNNSSDFKKLYQDGIGFSFVDVEGDASRCKVVMDNITANNNGDFVHNEDDKYTVYGYMVTELAQATSKKGTEIIFKKMHDLVRTTWSLFMGPENWIAETDKYEYNTVKFEDNVFSDNCVSLKGFCAGTGYSGGYTEIKVPNFTLPKTIPTTVKSLKNAFYRFGHNTDFFIKWVESISKKEHIENYKNLFSDGSVLTDLPADTTYNIDFNNAIDISYSFNRFVFNNVTKKISFNFTINSKIKYASGMFYIFKHENGELKINFDSKFNTAFATVDKFYKNIQSLGLSMDSHWLPKSSDGNMSETFYGVKFNDIYKLESAVNMNKNIVNANKMLDRAKIEQNGDIELFKKNAYKIKADSLFYNAELNGTERPESTIKIHNIGNNTKAMFQSFKVENPVHLELYSDEITVCMNMFTEAQLKTIAIIGKVNPVDKFVVTDAPNLEKLYGVFDNSNKLITDKNTERYEINLASCPNLDNWVQADIDALNSTISTTIRKDK